MTSFESTMKQFLEEVKLEVPQGVLVELDQFLPEAWSASVEDGVHVVSGPAHPRWKVHVRRLASVVAYAEGSILRRVSNDHWELHTWRNSDGLGFKVIFLAV